MNPSISDWTIEIAGEVEGKQGDFPTNLASDALARFFTLLGLKTNAKGNSIPLFRTGQQEIRLLILTPYSTKTLEEYFRNLLLGAYGKETMDLSNQRFLFIDSKRESQSDRFFHVMGSIFKHAKIGRKVDMDKLLTLFSPEFIKWVEDSSEHKTETEGELRIRNCIEETCFATGVEEMREFLLRDPVLFHNMFDKLVTDEGNQNKEDVKIKQGVIRLIFGAYLAGDIDREILGKALGEFSDRHDKSLESLNNEVEDLNRLVHPRFKNPLWKYLKNRKILIIDDCWEEEGWSAVLPAILLSPERSLNQCVSRQLFIYENVSEALHDYETKKFDLKDIDLILLDLYSSISSADRPRSDRNNEDHKKAIQVTNMKYPLWQFIEILNDIRKCHIEKSIPQPMPQIIVFSRDNHGVTVRTMFKELNAADYFFKVTGAEEHKCGYYSSFRNAVISALKETVYQVGGMTDIPSRLHFNRWLRQFDPCDRPLILHLMKHFKYFPALNIMKLLDSYLTLEKSTGEKHTRWEGNAVSILNSRPRKPDRFFISYLGHPNKSGPTTMALLSKTKWLRELRKDAEKHHLEELPKFLSYEDLLHCLVEDILTKDDKDEHVCLMLIDDFIGSGGQIQDYLKKFIDRDLKTFCEKLFVKPRSRGGTWGKVKRAFNEGQDGHAQNIEIMALFALGAQNKDFESFIEDSESSNDDPHWINGIYNLKTEGLSIPVKIHVAHYTRSIQEIFKDNQNFLMDVKKTLSKYSVIRKFRDEDHPCDFEPLGWKENGGLIATYANAQGNTIPVIWRDYQWDNDSITQKDDFSIKEWFALYPRYFNPLTPGKKRDKNEKKDNVKSTDDDEKKLACKKEPAECPINPARWDKQFFDDYWKNQDNKKTPPCKNKN